MPRLSVWGCRPRQCYLAALCMLYLSELQTSVYPVPCHAVSKELDSALQGECCPGQCLYDNETNKYTCDSSI